MHWRNLESKSKSTAYLPEHWNSSTTVPATLLSHRYGDRSRASSDRLCAPGHASAVSVCTFPAYLNHPFRRTRASDVGATLSCFRPGFPILASRTWTRQVEASIDGGQSSRTHPTGHAVKLRSRLRWQPRIIVRYAWGGQPRRKTKWRRPRYTLTVDVYKIERLFGEKALIKKWEGDRI